MTRIPLTVAATLLASACLVLDAPAEDGALARVTPDLGVETPDYRVELDPSELQLITLEVLRAHPMLSASPGIKHVDATRAWTMSHDADTKPASLVMANVIFHPHVESGGIKQAFQAHCQRETSNKVWSCPVVEIRRYVRLDSQDFEVRVKGDLDLAGIQAVIAATRQPAAELALRRSEIADTAIVLFSCGTGYHVSWGHENGIGTVGLEARLRTEGNPADPSDWEVSEPLEN
jgi:hypothetical protein